jgi:dolichol-phosphate mannosyltransferase
MYNEEAVVGFLRRALEDFMRTLGCDAEIILVNDGSTDTTLPQVADWADQDRRVKVIDLSRNFGHQWATTAGLDFATGDAAVILDADLQDPLYVIAEMMVHYCEGYDVVYGQRQCRDGETCFKRCTAWLFYRLMRRMVHQDLPLDAGDFRLISRQCLNGLQQMREVHRFLRGMVAWAGYPQISVPYRRACRVAGATKYSLPKMLRFAWTAATSFSTLPLKASIVMGIVVSLLGFAEGLRATLAHLFHWYAVPGWSSLTVLVSLVGGAILISVGVVGEYVGKIYEQTKDRPLYLVSRAFNVGAATFQHHDEPVTWRTYR